MFGSALRAPKPTHSLQGGEPVRTYKVGNGDTASFRTLAIMRDHINEAAQNYEVRKVAEWIIQHDPVASTCIGSCNVEKMQAVWNYLVKHSMYMHDPYGFEFIKTPPLVLAEIAQGGRSQLDCDDYTVTSLALLKSLGVPVEIRAASYTTVQGVFGKYHPLTHVYGLAWSVRDKAWLPVDCVNRTAGPGWEKTPYTRVENFKV